jgi:small subunit ribosomal protein S24e
MSIVSSNLKDDKLIGRRDVEAIIAYSKNLTRDDLKQIIAKHFGVDPLNVIIRKATYLTGTRIIKLHAHVYDSAEAAKKKEPRYILIRNKLVEKEKK